VEIQNDFVVDAPIERVWSYVLDVQKVAGCMPGAELTDVVDETTWKGKVGVKLGPVSMSFAGTVKMQERDDQAHRVVLKADGREQRGRGAASALVTANLEPADGGTKVAFVSDITITGAAAQYGRGMIQDISARLTGDFASCLQANIAAEQAASTEAPPEVPPSAEAAAATGEAMDAAGAPTAAEPPPAAEASAATPPQPPAPTPSAPPVPYVTARPVKGIRLGAWALWRAIVRWFKRLFGRRD
jgi:carbon monoxide dehydrogenase subunit G